VEATLAKRKEIAASIRQDAGQLGNPANPLPQMFRLLESLIYENDPAASEQAQQLAGQYAAGLKAMAVDQIKSKKDEIMNVNGAFQFVTKHKILPETFGPKADLEKIIKDQGWDKKR
jgi:hypothetical protein